VTKDQQQLHHISVLQAQPDSVQQAARGSVQQAALVDRADHARDALFSVVKYAAFAQKKT
jgi:hypothetical protein